MNNPTTKQLLLLALAVAVNLSNLQAQNIFQRASRWVQNNVMKAVSPVHGKYDENGNTQAPLTTFNRRNSFQGQLFFIREYIKNEKFDYHEFYADIYNKINNQSTDIKCSQNEFVCQSAILAKRAAFVYLIGLDAAGNDLTQAQRRVFYDKAVKVLKHADDNDRFGSFNWARNQEFRAEELLLMLQAHDYLNAAEQLSSSGMDLTYHKKDKEDAEESLAEFTYHLYRNSNDMLGGLDVFNNITLKITGAIGMAAVVLHDQGTYFWRTQKKPERWANAAHAYTNKTLWTGPNFTGKNVRGSLGAMSSVDDGEIGGYAEGPYYFEEAFNQLIPFFIAFNNFADRDMTGNYRAAALSPQTEEVRNYMHDPNYFKLYDWYQSIRMPNGEAPSYDDTKSGSFMPALALINRPSYSTIADRDILLRKTGSDGNLLIDYLVSANSPSNSGSLAADYINKTSGDLVIKSALGTPLSQGHYLRISAEKGTALNGYREGANRKFNHEHGDAGSFIIAAGEDMLAIDPAYFGEDNRDAVADGHFHNGITQINLGATEEQKSEAEYSESNGIKKIKVTTNYEKNKDAKFEKFKLERNIEVITGAPKVIGPNGTTSGNADRYYLINDYIKNETTDRLLGFAFGISGNGDANAAVPSCYIEQGKSNTITWDHPCRKDNDNTDNFKLRATVSTNSTIPGLPATLPQPAEWKLITNYSDKHGSNRINFTKTALNALNNEMSNITDWNPIGEDGYGKHSLANSSLEIGASQDGHFKVTIEVLGCADNYPAPLMILKPKHNVHVISRPPYKNVHYSTANPYLMADTVVDPLFLNDTSLKMMTDAREALLTYSSEREIVNKGCVTYSNFRRASITRGTHLAYNDTLLIDITNDSTAEVAYELTGKFRYEGVIKTATGAEVEFFMPDMEHGYQMTCKNKADESTIPNAHDPSHPDNFMKIKVFFPAGTTKFFIELVDPCLVSCFFPPTALTIDTLFDFNTGTTELLAHDLDATTQEGHLRITRGSKMSICENFVFRNIDSITMGDCAGESNNSFSSYGDYNPSKINNPMELVGTMRQRQKERNMIIVNDKAALVLDEGSRTHVGSLSTILIKKGGTLYVKRGAVLEVGDECQIDRGEVIVQSGGYVCVEEGADMHFFIDVDSNNYLVRDTIDRHIVYISMAKTDLQRANGEGAKPTVNFDGARGKFYPDSIYSNHACLEICMWKYVNLPHGVNNRPFGWCNISYPVSRYSSVDTTCINKPFYINAKKSLNETGYKIKVYMYDTTNQKRTQLIQEIISEDTSRLEDHIHVYTFTQSGHYDVELTVSNDCGEIDTYRKLVYVPPIPIATFTVNAACPGFGTVIADGAASNSFSNITEHRWMVSLITPDSIVQKEGTHIPYEYSWAFSTTTGVVNNFDFPGFRWVGGFKYLIGLSVKGWCGEQFYWDTVNFPLKAFAEVSRSNVYNNPVGPHALKLKADLQNATSFYWTPSDFLNDPYSDTPTALPTDPITYVLVAMDANGCTESDTIEISHNKIAYAGEDRNVCKYSEIVLGTSYNAQVFFGLMKYNNDQNNFTKYQDRINYGVQFSKYFTHHMMKDQYFLEILTNGQLGYFRRRPLRDKIMLSPWIKEYFEQYSNDENIYGDALEGFYTKLNDNNPYVGHADDFSFNTDIWYILNDYEYLFNNNYIQSYYSISWETKLPSDTIWTNLGDWTDYFNMPYYIDTTRQFRITVIDNELSTVEYDEVTITADELPNTLFSVSYQNDSITYFANYSYPVNNYTTYHWNFGDGTTSTDKTPAHQFPNFNASYNVCLVVTNSCTSIPYCDTLTLDSNGMIINNGFSKTGYVPAENPPKVINKETKPADLENKLNRNSALFNVPNPFSETTEIRYNIEGEFNKAEIEVVSLLGQKLTSFNLKSPQGKVSVNASNYNAGIYYYTLKVDGLVVKTQRMVISK